MPELTVYLLVKYIHISTALLSISCFVYRGMNKVMRSDYHVPKWLAIFPHANDTLLLVCAIYLSTASHQYPLSSNWLTAKVTGLIIYISLGMVVMRFARNQQQRLIAFILALISFFYIFATALSRSPTLGF